MKDYVILTDSCCDLSAGMAEELELSLSRRFYAIQMVWYTQQNGVFRSYNKAMFPLAEEK